MTFPALVRIRYSFVLAAADHAWCCRTPGGAVTFVGNRRIAQNGQAQHVASFFQIRGNIDFFIKPDLFIAFSRPGGKKMAVDIETIPCIGTHFGIDGLIPCLAEGERFSEITKNRLFFVVLFGCPYPVLNVHDRSSPCVQIKCIMSERTNCQRLFPY